jgi:hypothetical protein
MRYTDMALSLIEPGISILVDESTRTSHEIKGSGVAGTRKVYTTRGQR